MVAGARHELLVKIAMGGTATVFVGRRRGSHGSDDLVAVKRMHPYLAEDGEARAQMLREAIVARRVRHDNLVPIREVEEIGQELLIIMDYIEGASLAELVATLGSDHGTGDSPISAPAAKRIVLDACAGLSALHAVDGFVHRDVSPQNILVATDGTSLLGDFGLAKRTEVSMTHSNVVRGKLAYMAPEQIEGKRASQRSDVFSLAVVAWELLAGQRLFRGENDGDTMRRVMAAEVPEVDGMPPAVIAALSRRPEDRTATIAELARGLEVGAASHREVAEIVDSALGEALAKRRATVLAMADPETTATGNVDIDAMLEQARSDMARSAPVVIGDTSSTQSMDDLPTVTLADTVEWMPPIAVTLEPPPFAQAAPLPRRDDVAAKAPAAANRGWSTPAIVAVAVIGAMAGAGLMWLLSGGPFQIGPAPRAAPAGSETQSQPAPARESKPGTPSEPAWQPASAEPSAVATALVPRPRSQPRAPAHRAPAHRALPRPPTQPKPGKKAPKKNELVVPDNPYK